MFHTLNKYLYKNKDVILKINYSFQVCKYRSDSAQITKSLIKRVVCDTFCCHGLRICQK